jgi:hypothetical protein
MSQDTVLFSNWLKTDQAYVMLAAGVIRELEAFQQMIRSALNRDTLRTSSMSPTGKITHGCIFGIRVLLAST